MPCTVQIKKRIHHAQCACNKRDAHGPPRLTLRKKDLKQYCGFYMCIYFMNNILNFLFQSRTARLVCMHSSLQMNNAWTPHGRRCDCVWPVLKFMMLYRSSAFCVHLHIQLSEWRWSCMRIWVFKLNRKRIKPFEICMNDTQSISVFL